nr:STAS domain-containing protein [uncultured Desulfobacter sp.]
MNDASNVSGSTIHQVNNCLIASLTRHSDENSISRIGKALLKQLTIKRAKGVIIDVSDVTILSSNEFAILKNVARSISMMGSTPVFSGFQPGVAASLMDLDTCFDNFITARTIDDALKRLTTFYIKVPISY